VPRDAVAGRGPGLLKTAAGPLGIVVCYEVFFSARASAAVSAGGGVRLLTTSEVPAAELAAARMRALEFNRAVLQAAPTGYSSVVAPDGSVVSRTGLGTPGVLRAAVPVRTSRTRYSRTGDGAVLALAAVGLGASQPLRGGRRAGQDRSAGHGHAVRHGLRWHGVRRGTGPRHLAHGPGGPKADAGVPPGRLGPVGRLVVGHRPGGSAVRRPRSPADPQDGADGARQRDDLVHELQHGYAFLPGQDSVLPLSIRSLVPA